MTDATRVPRMCTRPNSAIASSSFYMAEPRDADVSETVVSHSAEQLPVDVGGRGHLAYWREPIHGCHVEVQVHPLGFVSSIFENLESPRPPLFQWLLKPTGFAHVEADHSTQHSRTATLDQPI